MVQACGRELGGILSLLLLIDEHTEAVESDLINLGLRLRRLGSEDFTWRDLKVIVSKSSTHSALVQEMNPEAATWGLDQQLLAEIVDALHWSNWTKTKGAQSKPPRDMPDPIPRPGVKPKNEVIKFDVMTQDEALDWLGWEKEVSDGN